ncbi:MULTISPECIES: 2OG-Fe(II) oxygenase family protein [unclassified Sphingobium]|uniref:2OG-Fe(II) oxygenase family protein n=1 Tax=unclassified Sphingobium TaxID=2611147 RepID=UPI0035A7242A
MWGDVLKDAARIAQGPDPAAARPLVERLLADRPGDPDALTLAGIVAQRTGDGPAAILAFQQACEGNPANPARQQNLAVALKNGGAFAQACRVFEEALRLRPGHAATLANMGSCLIAMDRLDDAIAVLAEAGDHPDALTNLGVALARTGETDRAITSYRRSLAARPGHVDTIINLADALARLGAAQEARDLLAAILRREPGHVRAANQLALLLEGLGDTDGGAGVLRAAFAPAAPNHALGVNLARLLIRSDAAGEATGVCDRLLATQPSVTTPLALKLAALTCLGDAVERARLMALDRFVTVHDLTVVPGFADMDAFNRALVDELAAHPSLTFEPEGLVTRNGRQSDELADATSPAIAALAGVARARLAVERERLGAMPADHPFLRAMPDLWTLTLWGTILRPGGAVGAHIHAPNWLSGVYYPAFDEGDGGNAGAFGIGMLPAELGGGGAVTVLRPRAGRMILFPSYLWHATLPFDAGGERVSFAFDLVPAGIGRPHRLR